jgi:phage recombination protein Bet
VEAIKSTCCPRGIPDAEFAAFVLRCKASGLNPLIGEAHCIARNDKNKGVVYTWQPSAEGMRARAGKFPDFVSCDGADVYERDVCNVDTGKGTVSHTFNAAQQRGRLVGAWGRVTKKGAQPVVVWLPVGSRNGNSAFWRDTPGLQLRKCSVVAAIREAYPVAFGGAYIAEEMPDASPAPPTRLESIAASVQAAPPPPPSGPVVEYGKNKGRAISALTDEERRAIHEEGQKLLDTEKMSDKVRRKLEANVALVSPAPQVIDAEVVPERQDLPMSHPDAQPPDEPGSEG